MNAAKALWLARRGRFGALFGLVTVLLFRRNLYYERQLRREGDLAKRSVHGYEMYLDIADSGIARTLLSYGTHEQRSVSVFRDEPRALADDVSGDLTVLDVGANVGYFALMAASVLGERATIHAIEPAPENVTLLERNVALNDYEDRITVERCALGDKNVAAELRLAERANCHTVHVPPVAPASDGDALPDGADRTASPRPSDDTVSVPQVTGDRFLAGRDVAPEDVNVVRMDVEGYETAVMAGLTDVLDASGPLVLYFEFHPWQVDPVAARETLATLVENGFEIVYSTISESGYDVRW